MLLNRSKNNGKSTEHSFLKEFMQIWHIIKFHNMRGKNEITVECCLAEYAFSYIWFFLYSLVIVGHHHLCTYLYLYVHRCIFLKSFVRYTMHTNMMLMVVFIPPEFGHRYIINKTSPLERGWKKDGDDQQHDTSACLIKHIILCFCVYIRVEHF
jgi:hypothetical protein